MLEKVLEELLRGGINRKLASVQRSEGRNEVPGEHKYLIKG
jgi:hypothetical protein